MKVRLIKPTSWGKPLDIGDEIEVDNQTARRWINNRIAEPAAEPVSQEQNNNQENENESAKTLDELSYAELREMAKEKEIPGYSKMNKEALLAALRVMEEQNDASEDQQSDGQNSDPKAEGDNQTPDSQEG